MPNPPDGVPVYGQETILGLAGLASVTMLRADRREPAPGQKPVACTWTGYRYMLLYRADEAVAMAPMSPGRQRLYDANRTCARCSKTSKWPWERERDGRRYCPGCSGPAMKELWETERAQDRPVITRWAAGVVGDPKVILAARRNHLYWQRWHIEDLGGEVLLAANVRDTDLPVEEDHPMRAEPGFETTVSLADIADQVAALADRRMLAWDAWIAPRLSLAPREDGKWGDPVVVVARTDEVGGWWSRWVGRPCGPYTQHHLKVVPQQPPWDPAEQVAHMRQAILAMAAGGDGCG